MDKGWVDGLFSKLGKEEQKACDRQIARRPGISQNNRGNFLQESKNVSGIHEIEMQSIE